MIELLLVAVAVGLDNFGAAIGLGTGGVDKSLRVRVGLVFGFFEAVMPVVGILAGRAAAGDLGRSGPPVAGVLLGAMGLYALVSALVKRPDHSPPTGPGIARILLLGVVLSIDNLVIGFALGSRHINLVVALVVIGVVSTTLSLLGLEVGRNIGARFGEASEVLGGLVLIIVGIAVGTQIL
jgi:manganese efflux pump family protein